MVGGECRYMNGKSDMGSAPALEITDKKANWRPLGIQSKPDIKNIEGMV